MNIKTLEDTPLETIWQGFVDGFSDYTVNISMPFEKFAKFITRNRVDLSLSVAAFEDDKIVGFIVNGRGMWNGIPTAYDSGTAVLPEYRKRGISGALVDFVEERLRENGIPQYLLEVIATNEPAVALYRKKGFEVTRNFDCYGGKTADLKFAATGIADGEEFLPDGFTMEALPNDAGFISGGSVEKIERMLESAEIIPSWQNSPEILRVLPGNFIVRLAYAGGSDPVGFVVTTDSGGDVPMLYVMPEYRGRGIGSRLLRAVAESKPEGSLAFINVDARGTLTRSFLVNRNVKMTISQFEMIKTL